MEFDSFAKLLNDKYDISALSIYTVKNGVFSCIYGEIVNSIEEYGAYTHSRIKESAIGLRDDAKYKSRFVTKFIFDDMEYILVLSSLAVHTFSKYINEIGKDILDFGTKIYNRR